MTGTSPSGIPDTEDWGSRERKQKDSPAGTQNEQVLPWELGMQGLTLIRDISGESQKIIVIHRKCEQVFSSLENSSVENYFTKIIFN